MSLGCFHDSLHVGKLEIAAGQRHGPAHGFQIIAPSARRAGIESQPRVAPPQFIPEFQVSLHVMVLSNPLPIRRIVFAPSGQRAIAVHIFTIPIESLSLDHVVNVLNQPTQRRRVAFV